MIGLQCILLLICSHIIFSFYNCWHAVISDAIRCCIESRFKSPIYQILVLVYSCIQIYFAQIFFSRFWNFWHLWNTDGGHPPCFYQAEVESTTLRRVSRKVAWREILNFKWSLPLAFFSVKTRNFEIDKKRFKGNLFENKNLPWIRILYLGLNPVVWGRMVRFCKTDNSSTTDIRWWHRDQTTFTPL